MIQYARKNESKCNCLRHLISNAYYKLISAKLKIGIVWLDFDKNLTFSSVGPRRRRARVQTPHFVIFYPVLNFS